MRTGNGTGVPPAVAFAGALAVFAAGVLIGGVPGAIVLGTLAVLAGALLASAWPRLRPAERTVRLLVLLMLAVIAISVVR
jgi:hypothetical protein